jgi:Fur family peroxide stress response transcriptional regulator
MIAGALKPDIGTTAMRVFECAGKRYRMTPQRQAVLDVARQAGAVSDPSWVYEEVRKTVPNISQATVQRTLSLLQEAGLLKVPGPEQVAEQLGPQNKVQIHVHCVRCERTVDATIDAGMDLDGQAASTTGFVIQGHHLDFRGLCPDCAGEGNSQ